MKRGKDQVEMSGRTMMQLEQITHLLFHRIFSLADQNGLHPGQVPLMHLLGTQDGVSPKELKAVMHIRPSTITVMVQRMEKGGFIERRKDGTDQRRYRIYLTEKGRNAYRQIADAVPLLEQEMLRGMTEEKKRTLNALLSDIRENLLSQEEARESICAGSFRHENEGRKTGCSSF